jgi:hypothetical protein
MQLQSLWLIAYPRRSEESFRIKTYGRSLRLSITNNSINISAFPNPTQLTLTKEILENGLQPGSLYKKYMGHDIYVSLSEKNNSTATTEYQPPHELYKDIKDT